MCVLGCLFAEGEHEHQVCEMQGLVEGPSLDDQGECFSPLVVNATSVNVEVYYNKAVNYTLMVTFVSLPIQLKNLFSSCLQDIYHIVHKLPCD